MPFQPRIAFPVPDQNTIIFFLDLCIHFFISFDRILSENIWHGKEILYTVFPFKFYILLQIDVPDFAVYHCIKLSFVLYTCRYTAFFFACCFCYTIRIAIESRCCCFHSTTGFFPSVSVPSVLQYLLFAVHSMPASGGIHFLQSESPDYQM